MSATHNLQTDAIHSLLHQQSISDYIGLSFIFSFDGHLIMKLKTLEIMSRSEMNVNRNHNFEEIDECSLHDENGLSRKHSFNQKTQKFISNISKLSIPQFFRRSLIRNKKTESTPEKRPVSMYISNQSESSSTLDHYMHDSTILMALQDTEAQLIESEKHRFRLETKVDTLEKEVSSLQKENGEYLCRERALLSQIQELERRCQCKDAEAKEFSLNARIKEMELLSEIATLSQKLSNIDTERQELKIQKIMECQNRIMEQTLPYTASVENIYDNEDGLFNAIFFDEILKEQSNNLDEGNTYRKLSSQKNDEDDNLLIKDSDIFLSNSD